MRQQQAQSDGPDQMWKGQIQVEGEQTRFPTTLPTIRQQREQ
ncbi:MAG: hypothetical protein AAGF95_30200 [Chloroflexota bacterium]